MRVPSSRARRMPARTPSTIGPYSNSAMAPMTLCWVFQTQDTSEQQHLVARPTNSE